MIVIAQRIWQHTAEPKPPIVGEGQAMLACPYIEIDGVRYENIHRVKMKMGPKEFTTVRVDFIDTAVVRLVDHNGNYVGGQAAAIVGGQ